MNKNPLSNWVPYKLLAGADPHCRWLNTSDIPFSDPFFSDTISKCKRTHPYHRHSVSNINLLPGWSATLNAVPPSAFIFHISRCGSTLLSQLLALNPGNIVLSEVPFFDEILRSPLQQQHTPGQIKEMLTAAMRFYGQQRTGNEKRLFVKTDSWHIFFHRILRELYPDVPFILLYRKPEEVIRSQQKKRGMQAVPGLIDPVIFGFDNGTPTDLDEYMAGVIERYLMLFLEVIETDTRSLLVNYNQGMLEVTEQMAAFTGLDIGPGEREKMKERCQFHAKYPNQVFAEEEATTNMPEALAACNELYAKLEQKRSSLLQFSKNEIE